MCFEIPYGQEFSFRLSLPYTADPQGNISSAWVLGKGHGQERGAAPRERSRQGVLQNLKHEGTI